MYVTKDEAVVVGAVVTSAIVVATSAAVVAIDTADAVVDADIAAVLPDTCSQHNSNTIFPYQQFASPPAP